MCKYIDIPLQHISNLTLLAMQRPPRDHTTKLLHKMRERIPGLVLRTTFISGFPGESDEQHRELVDFAKEFKFERMGSFAYSEEDNTPAASYPDQVAQETRCVRQGGEGEGGAGARAQGGPLRFLCRLSLGGRAQGARRTAAIRYRVSDCQRRGPGPPPTAISHTV